MNIARDPKRAVELIATDNAAESSAYAVILRGARRVRVSARVWGPTYCPLKKNGMLTLAPPSEGGNCHERMLFCTQLARPG